MSTIDHDAWDAWHPEELVQRLNGVRKPWCIVGGWALDLWHGRQTRDHADLEFTVLRGDFQHFRDALAGCDFYAAGDGVVAALPADQSPPLDISQIWCRDPEHHCWRVDMMFEPGTLDTWVCKRDHRITRPRAEMVRENAQGVPYLNPAAVLLFKAKYRRDKDEIDFRNALPALAASERDWLKRSLELVHPGHQWIEVLQR